MAIIVLAGDKAELAIEAVPEEPIDPKWVHGRFLLWVSGTPIGEPTDAAMLRGVLAWWRDFVKDLTPRWDDRLARLSAQEAFSLLVESAFGEASDPVSNAMQFSVSQLGMSSFDAYDVFVVDDPGLGQRLLWRHRSEDIGEAVLPHGAMQTVGQQFLAAWRSAGLPE